MILKCEKTSYLISINFVFIEHVLKKSDWTVTQVNNLNYNLITSIKNSCYNFIN